MKKSKLDISDMMSWWPLFLLACARMELQGIPMDMTLYRRVIDNRQQVIQHAIEGINGVERVFDQSGRLMRSAVVGYARGKGVQWPVKASTGSGQPYYTLEEEALKTVGQLLPFIEDVRQVKKTVQALNKRNMVIDPITVRHYFSTCVFRSITGRNQPRQWIFGAPKWMRMLVVPESPEHVLLYTDCAAQEIGIAAALSGDEEMKAMYASRDPHMHFAIRSGAAPKDATKSTHPQIRSRYKAVNLGMQYGQGADSIAESLGISTAEARAIVRDHKELFATFWQWSDAYVQQAYDNGYVQTRTGWRCKVSIDDSDRTWRNWPMQAAGADIMRIAMAYMDRMGLKVLTPIHDAFLISSRRDELDKDIEKLQYACDMATAHVIPGFKLRWDIEVFEDRYQDKDGMPMWNRILAILEEVA